MRFILSRATARRDAAARLEELNRMRPQMPDKMGVEEWHGLLKMNYEDLGREIQVNGTYAWTMGGIFFAAGLGIIGLILTRDVNAAPAWIQVLLGGFALALIWSWLLLLFRLGDINQERYFLRSVIEPELGLAEYVPQKSGSARFFLVIPAALLHLFWIGFSWWLLPSSTCPDALTRIALLGVFIVALLFLSLVSVSGHMYRRAWSELVRETPGTSSTANRSSE